MKPPLIFSNQPKITEADKQRILPHLGNVRIPLREWLATNPDIDDLKRAVVLEVMRAGEQERHLAALGRGVLAQLMKRIQQLQHSELEARIMEFLT